MDIHCPKCGEPWDSYHVRHDMTPQDSQRFLRGEGCEACNFGTRCTHCEGTGFEPRESCLRDPCSVCHDKYYTFIRVLRPDGACFRNPSRHRSCTRLMDGVSGIVTRTWQSVCLQANQPIPGGFILHHGYLPSVHTLTPDERARALALDAAVPHECRDGWYLDVKVRCWRCTPTLACGTCHGTGQFTPQHTEAAQRRTDVFAAAQLLRGDVDGMALFLEDHS